MRHQYSSPQYTSTKCMYSLAYHNIFEHIFYCTIFHILAKAWTTIQIGLFCRFLLMEFNCLMWLTGEAIYNKTELFLCHCICFFSQVSLAVYTQTAVLWWVSDAYDTLKHKIIRWNGWLFEDFQKASLLWSLTVNKLCSQRCIDEQLNAGFKKVVKVTG